MCEWMPFVLQSSCIVLIMYLCDDVCASVRVQMNCVIKTASYQRWMSSSKSHKAGTAHLFLWDGEDDDLHKSIHFSVTRHTSSRGMALFNTNTFIKDFLPSCQGREWEWQIGSILWQNWTCASAEMKFTVNLHWNSDSCHLQVNMKS